MEAAMNRGSSQSVCHDTRGQVLNSKELHMQQRDRVIALLDTSPTTTGHWTPLLAFGKGRHVFPLHVVDRSKTTTTRDTTDRRQTTDNVNASGVVFGSLGLNVD